VPELPEVETLRRGLATWVAGRTVESVEVLWPPTLDASTAAIENAVIGHRVTGVDRRGKMLLVHLDSGFHLTLHPRMTGQLVVTNGSVTLFAGGHPSRSMLAPMPNITTRAIVRLRDGVALFFNDQRKFGRIKLVDTPSLCADRFLARLGPEPLSDEFTVAGLGERLRHHRRAPIKAVLLAQSTVAGLGNIYTDEALHLARIHPCRPAGSLTHGEVRRLHRSIRSIIAKAIDDGGTSFADYANAFRGHGSYLARARVFRRQGQPCRVCGTTITRMRVAGRGTNVCPHCQPRCGSRALHAGAGTGRSVSGGRQR
jgi:formamidopyrimidine-DNA glycosylase